MNRSAKIYCTVGLCSLILIVVQLTFSPAIYFSILNYLGPSTVYYEPTISGAERRPDGKYVAYLGDRIFVHYTVVRHRINGSCFLRVYRYGEELGGPYDGQRHLLDYAELQFSGDDKPLRPRWPLQGLVLGYAVNKEGAIQEDEPLLAPGVDSQEFALYVVARYYCNFMDELFPRYLQGGIKPNETERVHLIVKRKRQ